MKTVFILIQALFLLTTMLNAGTMQIQNTMPKRGIDTVIIQYTASKASLAKAKKIYAFEILDNLDLLQRCRIEQEITQQPKKPK
jgi:hypothetical protein